MHKEILDAQEKAIAEENNEAGKKQKKHKTSHTCSLRPMIDVDEDDDKENVEERRLKKKLKLLKESYDSAKKSGDTERMKNKQDKIENIEDLLEDMCD